MRILLVEDETEFADTVRGADHVIHLQGGRVVPPPASPA